MQDPHETPSQRRRIRPWALMGAGAALIGVLVFLFLQPAPQRPEYGALPDLTLPLLSGDGSVSLRSLKGKPVVLNFWASWCGPCREEAPMIERVWQDYRDQGVLVIGVATQDIEERARDFVNEEGLTYQMLRDPGARLFKSLQLMGLPQTLFVGRDGSFLEPPRQDGGDGTSAVTVLGAIDEEQLRRGIEAILAGGSQ